MYVQISARVVEGPRAYDNGRNLFGCGFAGCQALAALSMKTLQVGVTTDEEMRTLSERCGGRFTTEGTFTEPRPSSYSLGFSGPYLQGADGYHTLPGRRLWMADVELMIRDRRLVQSSVSLW
jgi:hypothetical protein